ncbi:MAG: HAD-IIIC family phosphatase [bacterium]
MNPVGPYIESTMGCTAYFPGYNQFINELLNTESPLYTKNEIQILFLHLDGEELLKDAFYFSQYEEDSLLKYIENILQYLSLFLEKRKDVIVIISTVLFPPFHYTTHLYNSLEFSYRELTQKINAKITSYAKIHSHILLFDFERIVALFGYRQICDEKFWYLGKIRYNNIGFQLLAGELHSLLDAYRGKSKKVLVVDLDNTLWGGVLGEEGVDGLLLSEDGEGKIYRDFQKALRSLKNMGVLFAVNSKNNESDVRELFDIHPMMVFKYDDFIIKKINWENKAANMIAIAEELNLGLDSIVFIDDSSVEREMIRRELPDVVVPEMPGDKTMLKKWFLSEVIYQFFPKVFLTPDDAHKTQQYQANIQRTHSKKNLNLAEFISGLKIKLQLFKNDASIKNRIAQLTQKTNQFNLRTQRYTDADIENFLKSGTAMVYGISYEDIFGKEGIIGAAIITNMEDTCFIDTFLMSCRIIGRDIEYQFLHAILNDLQKQKKEEITAQFIPTKKNALAESFYITAGFSEQKSGLYIGVIRNIKNILSKKVIHGIIINE